MAGKETRTTKSQPAKKAAPRLKKPRRGAPIARPQKPIFGAGTLISIVVLAGLIAAAIYLNKQKELPDADATPTSGITFAFPPEELGNPSSIEIAPAEGEAVRVARNADGAWALELPEETEADQGQAEAAASQVSSLRIIEEIADADPSIFGLDKPAYVVKVKFTGGTESVLEIGDSTPSNSGYYARVDNGKMMILSLDGINSLLSLVSFPPYLNTPTPSPLPPTETPIPPAETSTPETSLTPAATSTP
ncbi:MAG: DUF4340 domain-containing protein [Chloroflexi bacterium]|nr:DUF4340 domain-containing protein [Chloroflexota bacterium]